MLTLVINDGLGVRKESNGNAVKLAGTPYMDKLKKDFPHTLLSASGEAVGLSKGQMGNSEVGHLTIGAGKVVLSDLEKISSEIDKGNFENNPAFLTAVDFVQKYGGKVHIMGLFSDGGVHSKLKHLDALLRFVKLKKVNYCLHAFMDGRDTLQTSGIQVISRYLEQGEKIASLCGRVYAMDREKRWDRVEKAYDMLVLGQADNFYDSPITALEDSYKNGITDEFVNPTIIGRPQTIDDGDAVIFFNFRSDRAREITESITEIGFDKFERKHTRNICFVCMTEYDATLHNVLVAFKQDRIENNLSNILSNKGLKQFHISETTKYAHVTFFFNGGNETPYKNEERKLIESYNDKNFAEHPLMKCVEITTETLGAIADKKYDFILVNLSNADMIGHTGDIEAAKRAITCVDKCAYSIALASILAGGTCIITADHGNAEEMLDKKGNVLTSHTTNPVDFILVDSSLKDIKLMKDGGLSNIAPTILKIMGIDIPKEMNKPLY